MKRFARLYSDIDETTSTNRKVDAMVEYFVHADAADAGSAGRRSVDAGFSVRAAGAGRWCATASVLGDGPADGGPVAGSRRPLSSEDFEEELDIPEFLRSQ